MKKASAEEVEKTLKFLLFVELVNSHDAVAKMMLTTELGNLPSKC